MWPDGLGSRRRFASTSRCVILGTFLKQPISFPEKLGKLYHLTGKFEDAVQ